MRVASIARRMAALLALAASMAHAAPATDPAGATADLYARMSARDLAGVLRYVPRAGFTELAADAPAPHVLAPPAFEALLGSGQAIALRAEDLHVQRFGDAAIVTGVRVGAVGPTAGSTSPEPRVPFTMVWTKDADGWRLRHAHLSAPLP